MYLLTAVDDGWRRSKSIWRFIVGAQTAPPNSPHLPPWAALLSTAAYSSGPAFFYCRLATFNSPASLPLSVSPSIFLAVWRCCHRISYCLAWLAAASIEVSVLEVNFQPQFLSMMFKQKACITRHGQWPQCVGNDIKLSDPCLCHLLVQCDRHSWSQAN